MRLVFTEFLRGLVVHGVVHGAGFFSVSAVNAQLKDVASVRLWVLFQADP